MIKIGQIGIGHNHGAGKMETVRGLPELFEVVGYAEENDAWVAKRGHLPAYAGLPRLSVEGLLSKCDAVIVETDVWDLTKTAQLCIDAGKHVHMDKPASGSLAEYKKLLDTAQAKGLTLQLGYMYRYNPAVQEILSRVQSGQLGQIYSINAEMSTRHPPKFRSWLQNFSGGIMYILGSHMIDLIVYLMGKPLHVHSFLTHSMQDGIDVPDIDLAVLEYPNALARVFVSSVEVNGFGRRQFVVSGSKATANICPMENPVCMTWSDLDIADKAYADRKISLDFENPHLYDTMLQAFFDYITGKKENPFTYEHEYAVQEVLDAAVGGIGMLGRQIG